ncbi:MAG: DNA-binding NarL/FixJ family response regulator [Verrucomicrobiales bacterium]|jgi:DNA-binding NarL/FixJ family response regulator
MSASKKKKVLIIDDHPAMRSGLGMLVNSQPDWEVCGEAGSAREGFEAIQKLKPSLALVDLALPDKSGLELLKDVRASELDVIMLVISSHDENLYAERALRSGARGYVMKEEASDVLIEAIGRVLGGQVYLSQRMSALMLEMMTGQKKKGISPVDQLTDRELEVFTLIGEGIGTHEIAERLCISHRTVDAHRAHIRTKLKILDSNALIRYAVRWVETEQDG